MLIGMTALTMGVMNWANGLVGAAMGQVGAVHEAAPAQGGDKP
jgi:hypothetical protein